MSGPRQAEVVVAGAGPAGCHAAMLLARRGLSVLLVDRARFPRYKPCAGAISASAFPRLPLALQHLLEPISEARLALGPDRLTAIRTARPVGWLVQRERFDHAHLELVRALDGVAVLEECRVHGLQECGSGVVVETSRGQLRARAVIGADGVEGVVARAITSRQQRRYAVAWEVEAPTPQTAAASAPLLFDFAAFPGGYGWIFPKTGGSSAGGFISHGPARGIRELCAAFRRRWRPLYPGHEPSRHRGYRIPLGGEVLRLDSDRVVLAGDAAAAVDPITGEGIAHALASASLAAEAVHGLLTEGQPLAAYSTRMWRQLHAGLAVARRLADLLYRHPQGAFSVLFRNPVLCRWFLAVLRGEVGYPAMLLRALLRWPELVAARPTRRQEREQIVELDLD